MACSDNEKIDMTRNLDRISELPEPIILTILSCLPLRDSSRASILSKTWRNYCRLYPIIYFDHNLFALQSLVSANANEAPDISQLREMFMDDVDHRLTSARNLDSPIRKLALNVAVNDPMYFPRVDNWIELVRQLNVEDLCITVQMVHFWCIPDSSSIAYEFPVSVLTSKGLRKVYIRGCKLGHNPIYQSWSLVRLCLSHVYINIDAFENLISFCQGIETLIFENCTLDIGFLVLSKFPKLKKIVIIEVCGGVDYIDIVNTNLECIDCGNTNTKLYVSAAACAGIREIEWSWAIINQPNLFKDLTCTFPLLEKGVFQIHDTNTLKADSSLLRELTLYNGDIFLKELYIDCPGLIDFHFECHTEYGDGLEELYLNCPKLRDFHFVGLTAPQRCVISSMAELESSSCIIFMMGAYDTAWLMKLREFLLHIIGNTTYVDLTLNLPIETFERELVEAIEVSPRHNICLRLVLYYEDMENVVALLDGLLWIIRPTNLIISCQMFYAVKYLCENLAMKEEESLCHPCWMLQLESFDVEYENPLESDALVTKENLSALPEECQTDRRNSLKFNFRWFIKQVRTEPTEI